ncbi:restriction endonuclease subunit S [Streptococcus anginosus]|uniref:restriction endonuclease subunit S n=2 Tax=Streptococcus anginosus TaxID=1328 RepID=UPI0021F8E2E2|nr:restriction endonuclease subunit S [Streptococcus anginosus]MCW1000727.1 restriction endonuclease subunit S [Streptococcus anginosus]WEB14038.1 restriction endonuclease subunit S [Streptococcus anginosus]
MNILEEIQNCPVEWKELGEVCEVKAGKNINKTFIQNNLGNFPVINSGKEPLGYINIFNIQNDPIGITSRGAGVGYVSWNEGKYFRGNLNYSATVQNDDILLPRFLYFYLKKSSKEIENLCTFDGIPALNKSALDGLSIPIPPIEIQEKIVQILDKFTEYVTELTSELTSRKKQYSFYRDKLLSFEDEVYQVEWKRLNEFLKKGKGTKITASQMKLLHKEGAPIRIFAGGKTYADVNYGDIPDKDIHTEEAIVVKSRGIIDFEYCTEPFSFKNEFWSYSSDNENINLRYIYHYLVHNKEHFQNIANNMQMPQISSNDTEKFKIPVPSLEIQSRIVQVLDNFDMVCHDLNIGLPKEIELRQKQYEYFRDKLLTFIAEGEYTESRVEEWDNSAIIKLLQWVFGPIRVKVGQVVNLQRGKRLVRKQLTTLGSIPVYQNSLTPLGYYTESNRVKNTSFVICAGAAGEIGYSAVDFWAADDVYTLETSDNISDKFMYYVLLSKQDRLKSQVRKASIPRLSKDAIDKVTFYLPSLTEQKRIVSILDHFNTLTTSISEGLPKEIEQRQKQYEYWREQLLNFTR